MRGIRDSEGHRRWITKGHIHYSREIGWTFSNRQWMVVEMFSVGVTESQQSLGKVTLIEVTVGELDWRGQVGGRETATIVQKMGGKSLTSGKASGK